MGWALVGSTTATGSGGSGWEDAYAFALELGVTDALGTPSDVHTIAAEAAYADTQATPAEALTVGVLGPSDTNTTPTEARDSLIVRWATTTSTSGTAPTSPANATGQANGTVATVKAGGLANGTSGLTVNIVAPFAEITSGTTRTLRAYYAVLPGAAGDTFTANASYRQVGSGSNTTVALPITGDHLAAGTPLTLTNIDPAVTISVTFTHAHAVPTAGGSLTVDAVGVETQGAL